MALPSTNTVTALSRREEMKDKEEDDKTETEGDGGQKKTTGRLGRIKQVKIKRSAREAVK